MFSGQPPSRPVFSIEGKVIGIKEFTDHQQPGMSLAAIVLIKATRFWGQGGYRGCGL